MGEGFLDGPVRKDRADPQATPMPFAIGLAAVQRRQADGELTQDEQDIRTNILAGLIADKGGEQQIGTAERILAEIISRDVALLVTFNQAIEGVINQKARQNPKALAQLDGYKRGLVNSLTGNLQRFGFQKVAKVETLQEIISEVWISMKIQSTSTPARMMTLTPYARQEFPSQKPSNDLRAPHNFLPLAFA